MITRILGPRNRPSAMSLGANTTNARLYPLNRFSDVLYSPGGVLTVGVNDPSGSLMEGVTRSVVYGLLILSKSALSTIWSIQNADTDSITAFAFTTESASTPDLPFYLPFGSHGVTFPHGVGFKTSRGTSGASGIFFFDIVK